MRYALHLGASSERLLLFFAGWGMDDAPFVPMLGAFDTAVVWDYTDITSPLPFLKDYARIDLIAWSMGVWAATQVLADTSLHSAVAVNGTPWPIDDTRGIPTAVFDATLVSFSEAGLTRFRRRMCGGTAAMNAFMEHAPARSVEELRVELDAIGNAYRTRGPRNLAWTAAAVCASDRIFPPEAQKAAFPGAKLFDGAHWAPDLFARLLKGETL